MARPIGHGVTLRFFVGSSGRREGAIVEHPAPGYGRGVELGATEPDRCAGAIAWAGSSPQNKWTLVRGGRLLTLTPSIQCRVHPDFHGYITDGRWIEA